MIWIKGIQNQFTTSDELRECGRAGGFLDSDDYSTGIVYMRGWVGFAVNQQLPDQAIENGISEALSNKLGIDDPTFGFDMDANHPGYSHKGDELEAIYNGDHPDQ